MSLKLRSRVIWVVVGILILLLLWATGIFLAGLGLDVHFKW